MLLLDKRTVARFSRPHPQCVLDRANEYFSVADLRRLVDLDDFLHHTIDGVVGHDEIEFANVERVERRREVLTPFLRHVDDHEHRVADRQTAEIRGRLEQGDVLRTHPDVAEQQMDEAAPAAMLALAFVGRGTRGRVQVAGAR